MHSPKGYQEEICKPAIAFHVFPYLQLMRASIAIDVKYKLFLQGFFP